MVARETAKVSYCTTCKGRLHHLMETLPANLKAEENNPDIEFVILDYGSDDGLAEWIERNFMKEIKSGRLIYARTEAEDFQVSHAKNMAHRLATGNILCNLDADNRIVPNFSRWLQQKAKAHSELFISSVPVHAFSHVLGKMDRKYLGKHSFTTHPGDITGRMSVSKDLFEKLGGYDESINSRRQDIDFAERARSSGATIIVLPQHLRGSAIPHSDEERVCHKAEADQIRAREYLKERDRPTGKNFSGIAHLIEEYRQFSTYKGPRSNIEQVGCGEVIINFSKSPSPIHPLGRHIATLSTVPKARRTDWALGAKRSNDSVLGR